MRQIFTYPNNQPTNYIDPQYEGDASSGFYRRIDDLLDGTYKPWYGADPIADLGATTPDIEQNLSKFINYFDNIKSHDNLTMNDFWKNPLIVATRELIAADIILATAADPVVFTSDGNHNFNDEYHVKLSQFNNSLTNYNTQEFYVQKLTDATFNLSYDQAGNNLLGISGEITDNFSAFDMNEPQTSAIKINTTPYTTFTNQTPIDINSVTGNGQELVGNTYYLKGVSPTVYELYEDQLLTNPLTQSDLIPFNNVKTATTIVSGNPAILRTSVALSADEMVFYLTAADQTDPSLSDDLYFLVPTADPLEYEIYLDHAHTQPLDTSYYTLSGTTENWDYTLEPGDQYFSYELQRFAMNLNLVNADLDSRATPQFIQSGLWFQQNRRPFNGAENGFTQASGSEFKLRASNEFNTRMYIQDWDESSGTYKSRSDTFNGTPNLYWDNITALAPITTTYYIQPDGGGNPDVYFDNHGIENFNFISSLGGSVSYGSVLALIVNPTKTTAELYDSKGNLKIENTASAFLELNPEAPGGAGWQKINFGSANLFVCKILVGNLPSGIGKISLSYGNFGDGSPGSSGSTHFDLDLIAEAFGMAPGSFDNSTFDYSIAPSNKYAYPLSTPGIPYSGMRYSGSTPQYSEISNLSFEYFNQADVAFLDTGLVNATIGVPLVDSTDGRVYPAPSNQYKFRIDQLYTKIGGDKKFQYQDANNVTQNFARPDPTGVWKEGLQNKTLYSVTGDTPADITILVNGDGRVTYASVGANKGEYLDNGDITFEIQSLPDQYNPPAPTPSEQQDIWDTDDEWVSAGFSTRKEWPRHVSPASATVNLNTPSITATGETGIKFSRSSGFTKWTLDVEYPPMTYDEFQEFHAIALAAQGQAIPFYFMLRNKDGDSILWGEWYNEAGTTTRPILREPYVAGDTTLLLEGFSSFETDAFKRGEIFVDGGNQNGNLHTVLNTVDANVFGEAKIRLPMPLRGAVSTGQKVYKNPYHAIVTMTSDDFEYRTDTSGYYYMSVSFSLDGFK